MRTRSPLLCLSMLLATGAAAAQDHAHPPASAERLGRVAFATSCQPAVQQQFERGVAMLHSFWFPEAERVFGEVLAADPGCAMAHWGVAMAKRGNPFAGAPAAANLAAGLVSAERAATLIGSASPRERGFVEAALAFYRGQGERDHRTRMAAYEEVMRRVHESNPTDVESEIFYAQSIIANAPPTDLTFARQQVAAGMLEPLFQGQPDHPGLAHYLIHAYDAPPLARRGLHAAARYSQIAPSAPHALHMPSHVFTRLGMWQESVESNRMAAQAAAGQTERVHPMDYLVYAYLQQGREREAEAIVADAVNATAGGGYAPVIQYNVLAMPARLALERERWSEAAALPLPAGPVPPEFEAIPRFTRGIGAARGGQPAAARAELAELERIEQALRTRGDSYWPVLVHAQRLAVEAWVAHAEGRHEESMRLGAEAAALEETVEKHPVTPGPLLPARELLGDLLLLHGRAAEAQRAYEANLLREPNRARSLRGAVAAANRAGDHTAHAAHQAALDRLTAGADAHGPGRPAPE